MMSEMSVEKRLSRLLDGGLDPEKLKHLKLIHHVKNPAVRRQLKEMNLHQFDSVLILADEALEADMMHSDSNSLAILLLVRDLQLEVKEFHTRSNASERRMSEMSSMVVSALKHSLTFGMKKKKDARTWGGGGGGRGGGGGVKDSEEEQEMDGGSATTTAAIVTPGAKGLKKMKTMFANKRFQKLNHSMTNSITSEKTTIDDEVKTKTKTKTKTKMKMTTKMTKTTPMPPLPAGSPSNAIDMLEEGTPPGKTNQIIDATSLEDSINIHRKRSGGSGSGSGSGRGSGRGSGGGGGFLSKLKTMKEKQNNEETKTTMLSKRTKSIQQQEEEEGETFSTANLQKKCLVTVELLDPQTHVIICQHEVSC